MRINEVIDNHVQALAELRKLDPESVVTCQSCNGFYPEPHLCGCGGFMLVKRAIEFHEAELEILSK